jgi:hypothetical protein
MTEPGRSGNSLVVRWAFVVTRLFRGHTVVS